MDIKQTIAFILFVAYSLCIIVVDGRNVTPDNTGMYQCNIKRRCTSDNDCPIDSLCVDRSCCAFNSTLTTCSEPVVDKTICRTQPLSLGDFCCCDAQEANCFYGLTHSPAHTQMACCSDAACFANATNPVEMFPVPNLCPVPNDPLSIDVKCNTTFCTTTCNVEDSTCDVDSSKVYVTQQYCRHMPVCSPIPPPCTVSRCKNETRPDNRTICDLELVVKNNCSVEANITFMCGSPECADCSSSNCTVQESQAACASQCAAVDCSTCSLSQPDCAKCCKNWCSPCCNECLGPCCSEYEVWETVCRVLPAWEIVCEAVPCRSRIWPKNDREFIRTSLAEVYIVKK